MMHPDALDFLEGQKICVLAVKMPDGTPHAATVHFAFVENPSRFVIMTNPLSRKHEAFASGPASASMVVGMDEESMKTLQMDGTVELSSDSELEEAYCAKFPKAAHVFKKEALFTFTPVWWRFTDWTRPEGKLVLSSED